MTLPFVPAWADPVWHLFVIRHPQRDALREKLAGAGIATLIHYPVPPHRSGAYAGLHLAQPCLPLAETLAAEVLSLPIGPHLTDAHARQITDAINQSLDLLAK